MNKANFPALTGNRIFAAFIIYIHHFNLFQIEKFGADVITFSTVFT